MLFGTGFEPDGVALAEQQAVGFIFGDDAAADGYTMLALSSINRSRVRARNGENRIVHREKTIR